MNDALHATVHYFKALPLLINSMLMKPFRIVLLLLSFMVCAVSARAQEVQPEPDAVPPAANSGLLFGLSVGPNFSELTVDFADRRNPDYHVVLGYHLGLFTGVRLGPLSARTGLSFVNVGAIFDGSDFLEQDEFQVHFLTVPIDLRLQVPLNRTMKIYAFAGPQFRYRLEIDNIDADFEDDLRHLSTTASIGLGVRFKVKGVPFKVSPELRYAIDITGLTDGSVTVRDEAIRVQEEFKADLVEFSLGLGF